MSFELRPITAPGERLVALAEEHAADFATRAEAHDRDNSFVAENFDAMKVSGILAACAPEQFGGLGVESVHDLMVGISRLARGCPSTAICANMQMIGVMFAARMWRQAVRSSDEAAAAGLAPALTRFGRSEVVRSGAGTESGGTFLLPVVEARPVEGGYLISGRKGFGTNSEIADVISTMVRVRGEDGASYIAGPTIPRGTKGMEVTGNWDALGMRGSGSHDIIFTDCFVPEGSISILGPIGPPSAVALAYIAVANFPLFGANLGIAEAARNYIVDMARTRRRKPFDTPVAERPAVQHQIAEIEAGLTAARAVLTRTGAALDARLECPDDELNARDMEELEKEIQCTKLIVNRAATEIVDRAMTVSGGSGYLSSSPLSRMCRDVRAGQFMQPYSPLEAYEFIGRVSFGLDPYAELRAGAACFSPGSDGESMLNRSEGEKS
jgi:alkylation response protein AidB-like acyl-CoA dehydrogenase